MAFLEPELEPAGAFALKRALIPLGLLVGFSFAYGACKTADALTRALFGTIGGTVGWIPWLGNILEAPIHKIEQKITSLLGAWAVASQEQIGDALHELTALVHGLGSAIANSPLLLYALAKYVLTLMSVKQWQAFYNSIVGTDRAFLGRIKTVERKAHANAKAAHAAAQSAAVAHKTAIAVPGQVAKEWDIAGLRARTKQIEGSLARAWEWIRARPEAIPAAVATALVATALARLGGSWIRCNNWKRLGRSVCGLPSNLLSDFLALLTDFFLLTNICQVIPWLESAFATVAAPLVDALTYVGAGLCDRDAAPPETLPPPGLSLPASVDATLYLP